MMAPSKSSVVLVAGSALMDMQGVMDKKDLMGKAMKMIPHVVILLVRDNDIVPDTVRNALSPPVVSLMTSNLNHEKPFHRYSSRLTSLATLALHLATPL